MKAVILAGGLGTRMQELTSLVPKPMVEIGGFPILWHIMKLYEHYGVNDFAVALGYKSEVVKDYFANYRLRVNSIRVDLATGEITEEAAHRERWRVDLVETGLHTQTGGRIARLRRYLGDVPFFATYGDGVADVDVGALLAFHRSHGKIATVTAVRPPSRFGALALGEGNEVTSFTEKPVTGDTWISGGFFVFEPGVFGYLSEDESCILERGPLDALARDGELAAFRHAGYWQGLDTARDVDAVNRMWEAGNAPWQVWA
ncbi:MAG: glucose-1-phosphate cytidylyltransferase [Devosia sp.]|nr:glucose-1-phosphate cytidylyltransferase [Devosia sp.]